MRPGFSAFVVPTLLLILGDTAVTQAALAQEAAPPPAVSVIAVARRQVTETGDFIGRVVPINKVEIVARVTGFIGQRNFTEGQTVKTGDLLFRIEQDTYKAAVDQQEANLARAKATEVNANLQLKRSQELVKNQNVPQSTVDQNQANEQSAQADILAAQALLEQAKINLGYTEIRAPIDGKISATQVTEGNVVSPTSGTLANIVSQDPMYVLFPIALRAGLDLRARYANKGGYSAVVIRLRLPDGRMYEPAGKLDYVSPTVGENTDTLNLRGVIPNPVFPGMRAGQPGARELNDGEFVTVLLEGVQPITVLGIPRAAVLSDQQGDYVYVVDAQNKAQVRRIQLGQSTPSTAVVTNGLQEGELVISEGLQRVRPGEAVSPGPATPGPQVGTSSGAAPQGGGAKPAAEAPAAKQ
jgi:membrane fusion protein, multidrug efflux system